MKAKRKPLVIKSASDFSINLTARTKLLKVTPPAQRQAGTMLDTIDELIEKLKNEAKVIS
jgi:electron transfer flavoprotein beta subunit